MVNSRTVRIFLSSTFRDFDEERDLLVKRVFPALRAQLMAISLGSLQDKKLLLVIR
jgi:hypothetical protein